MKGWAQCHAGVWLVLGQAFGSFGILLFYLFYVFLPSLSLYANSFYKIIVP